MYNAFFSGNIDVTVIILTTFILFFLGLVLFLRREDRREGYPLEDDVTGRHEGGGGLFFAATPKTFKLAHGLEGVTKPNGARDSLDVAAKRTSRAPGSPLEPTGDPMLAGVGPGAFAQRAHKPDLMFHGTPKLAPLRIALGFSVDTKDADPRGMKVVGADGVTGGIVTDIWVDQAEYMIRYLELAVTPPEGGSLAAMRHVLVPMTMAVINKSKKTVRVDAVLGSQFAGAPVLENADQITLYEEERVTAYYGAGYLYATAARSEPLI
jgi:photosynthetic reaction center H subunit